MHSVTLAIVTSEPNCNTWITATNNDVCSNLQKNRKPAELLLERGANIFYSTLCECETAGGMEFLMKKARGKPKADEAYPLQHYITLNGGNENTLEQLEQLEYTMKEDLTPVEFGKTRATYTVCTVLMLLFNQSHVLVYSRDTGKVGFFFCLLQQEQL